ncbi:MAG: sulfatase-like hydrolase/transferase [Planctomycetaceae bacterium]|nr:sulfatase-like hydrolase/transferase [Planctomycetaceae bacterium]
MNGKGCALACCLLLGSLGVGRNSAIAENAKPNIVLVMADDQGWGEMGYSGHPALLTPNFDRAAAAGVRFERFYAAAPVCSPTRASVLTGRHPNRSGVFKWGHPLRPQEITLAEVLKGHGYATAHFGKWHLGSVRRQSLVHPGKQGFDFWISAPNFFDNDPILSWQGKAVKYLGESSKVTVDAAIEWIRQISTNDLPFLAVVWFGSPHGPHQSSSENRAPYLDEEPRLQHFYGEITGMDRAFGKLRLALDDLNLRDDTILWYCSDNGALPKVGSAGPFKGHKGQVYEGGLLVPAFLEWPSRFTKPRSVKTRCNSSDIFPTLLGFVDLPRPHERKLDGIDLTPFVKGADEQRADAMGFWDYPVGGIRTPSAERMAALLTAQTTRVGDLPATAESLDAEKLPDESYTSKLFPGHAAWIDSDWKLHRITDQQGKVRWELYNLATDPGETNDLAAVQPSVVQGMNAALETWLRSVVASMNGEDYTDSEQAGR